MTAYDRANWQRLAEFLLAWRTLFLVVAISATSAATKVTPWLFLVAIACIFLIRLTDEVERKLKNEGGQRMKGQRGDLLQLTFGDWKFWFGIARLYR